MIDCTVLQPWGRWMEQLPCAPVPVVRPELSRRCVQLCALYLAGSLPLLSLLLTFLLEPTRTFHSFLKVSFPSVATTARPAWPSPHGPGSASVGTMGGCQRGGRPGQPDNPLSPALPMTSCASSINWTNTPRVCLALYYPADCDVSVNPPAGCAGCDVCAVRNNNPLSLALPCFVWGHGRVGCLKPTGCVCKHGYFAQGANASAVEVSHPLGQHSCAWRYLGSSHHVIKRPLHARLTNVPSAVSTTTLSPCCTKGGTITRTPFSSTAGL